MIPPPLSDSKRYYKAYDLNGKFLAKNEKIAILKREVGKLLVFNQVYIIKNPAGKESEHRSLGMDN